MFLIMNQEIVQPEESGLDIYLVVEAPSKDEMFKKFPVSLVDPTTGIVYHPITNPIPAGDKTYVN